MIINVDYEWNDDWKKKMNYSMKKLLQYYSAYSNFHVDRIASDRILASRVEN